MNRLIFLLLLLPGMASAFELLYSVAADRTTPVPLSQAELTGDRYVFVTPESGIQSVEFYLDDALVSVEASGPWDLKGGTATVANPWHTYTETAGAHTLRIEIVTAAGPVESVTADFTIADQGIPDPPDPDVGVNEGSVTLSWTAPTENTDGTPLTDLAGYKIYYGPDPGNYDFIFDIPDPLAITTIVEGLAPGTYRFVGTAYNTAGIESVYSNEITKQVVIDGTIPLPPSNLTAGVDTVAYAIQQVVTDSGQSLTLYPVGLVDVITVCDPFIKVSNAAHPNGLSLIQKNDVTFAVGADAHTVYAECGAG